MHGLCAIDNLLHFNKCNPSLTGFAMSSGEIFNLLSPNKDGNNFFLHRHCLFKHSSDENKGNNHQG